MKKLLVLSSLVLGIVTSCGNGNVPMPVTTPQITVNVPSQILSHEVDSYSITGGNLDSFNVVYELCDHRTHLVYFIFSGYNKGGITKREGVTCD